MGNNRILYGLASMGRGSALMVTKQDIIDGIRSLGLSSSIVCLHSSLKSFGHVEGGADTVVQAFVQEGCTLVVPTFLFDSQVPAPAGRVVARNGERLKRRREEVFRMLRHGIPAARRSLPAWVRFPRQSLTPWSGEGDHPLNSISALGPEAKELIAAQEPLMCMDPIVGPMKEAAICS